MIKKILEKNNPSKILINDFFSQIVNLLINKNTKVSVISKKLEKNLHWDKISIKHNIGNFPISFNISRQTYFKIKNFVEQLVCATFGLWYNFNKKSKKTILLLELYPPSYQNLLNELKKQKNNVVILNRRRSAVSDINSIKILRKTGCKVINLKKYLKKSDTKEIEVLTDSFIKKLKKLWEDDENFKNYFSFDNQSFWPIIKNKLLEIYKIRMRDYVNLIISAKIVLEKTQVSCILSPYQVGETEKAFLNVNENTIPSILLEHGFSFYFTETSKYDILASYSNFKDKIAVWSDHQKKYLVEQRSINPERIFVTGSPRHDLFFKDKLNKEATTKKTILIAPTPITNHRAHDEINMHIKFEKCLQNICKILQKHNANIIVKIHPGQAEHNNEIRTILSRIDPKIPIFLFTPINKLLNSSNAVITLTPEGFAPSTIILESLILKKPTMNIVLDEHFYDFEYIKNSAVKSISDNDDLEKHLNESIFNKEFSEIMINNGNEFIKKFLSNPGTASKSLASTLNSF